MVGADLENLLNEAALLAAREGRNRITGRDVDEARDRVLMGPERRSLVVRKLTGKSPPTTRSGTPWWRNCYPARTRRIS